ncbi:zinc finger protein 384-like isoform X2 [Periophthalmus magnuspinnatus]|uniref:zinc finger protein 384-like isoform X2 n=1 Tax=Periophthalmus magnuspinnatus TaxID=409849 RepID=UPI00145B9617|nr:zinc finger protein 384-like isoform X2 [Periophthalmus magnuspinnatus]
MEESHFNNSSYFWSPVTTVPGQVDKGGSFPPSSAPHYQPAVVTIPAPGAKLEGSNQPGRLPHHQTPHGAQNITVLPVSTTGIMTAAGLVITTPQGTLVSPNSPQSFVSGPPGATMVVSSLHATDTDKKVMPSPSKRGRKKKTTRIGPGGETIILAQLTPDGQVTPVEADPYDLSHDEDLPGPKDSTKTYRCRMCAATFFSKSDMQIHSKSHTEAKPHKCPHCSKSFANSSYLAQHTRIHSGAKPYTCSYCQKSFRQLSHLQQHTRNHTESKPHKCPHCTKSFANSSYLAQHFRIHTGVKPYACTVCEKSFRQLSHLQQHNRIHTGDRPYKCTHPGCEKSFTQLSNLQSHRRQHNKDKPYKCANCNKGYVDAASLEVHMATHTVKHARIYSCGLCNRSYTSETYLVRHMEKHSADQLASAAAGQANQQNRGVREEGKPEEASPSRPVASGAGGGAQQGGQAPSSYQQTESVPCPFDIHQYKTVAASDIQYKPVNVSEITAHKDLCLTVSTSTIQVDHLNS